MTTKLALFLLNALLWLEALSVTGFAKPVVSPAYLEVSQVVNSKELSQPEKVSRLREMIHNEETRWVALYQMDRIDAQATADTALAIFRSADTPRQVKLRIGHFMLEGSRPQRESFPTSFMAEFAEYLVQAVLDGGRAEFCRKVEAQFTTAVGEYACLASDFDGYSGIDFAPFKDTRVVPVLIRCLNAPDNVHPADQGDLIRGKPGESTGRNTARQQIPVALARLGDARAVEPLKTVLFNHTDIYERMNAAYALARLVERKEDRSAIGQKLLSQSDLLWCRLPFGKGLIEVGDDTGLEFLALKHASGYGDTLKYPHQIFYVLNQRLTVLQGFKSPKVEGFVRETLAFKQWHDMVLFKPGSVKIDPANYVKPPKDEAEALAACAPSIIQIYGTVLECVKTNHLKSLAPELEKIAKESRSEEVRKMTDEILTLLR